MQYKILFFSEILGAGGGGIASERIINSFKKHDIKVISISNEKSLSLKIKYFILRLYYRLQRFFLTTSDKFNFNSFNSNIGVYNKKKIYKKIDKFKPDIIVITWIEYLVSLETIYELKKKYNCEVIFIAMDNHLFAGGCRYVNECENYMDKCNNCLALKKWFKSTAIKNYSYYRFYFNKIKPLFMLPSHHAKLFYKKLNLDYRFLEFDFWPIQFENLIKNNNKNKNKDIKKRIIICPIQKFNEPRKGWEYLYYSIIDYQNQLEKEEINIHFIFIGKLENYHIRSFKNFRVSYDYYNYLSRKDLEKLYSESDFGVIPSIQEWASISTNEMMTFGLPVINFMTGSSKNIIIEGKNGFIVNLKNVYELSNKLKTINNMDSRNMHEMKIFTKNYAEKNFKDESFEKKLISFYEYKKRHMISKRDLIV
ncbi:glycosyltransferase [Candidatus Pelagibacter bacterium nBUS_25]|uniref:glycosyltransferase n=1 Tax=Candidatus Pelagibacter bacterium nBUS_25 TaxID=3374187 RepID=UPI003EBB08CB